MRKVLIATAATQGPRKNDFSHTREGELVTYGFECDREQVDGACGCKRSLIGMSTHKATTTFKVGSMDLNGSELTERIRTSLRESGWIGAGVFTPHEDEEFIRDQVSDTENLWNSFKNIPDGAVLERRGRKFHVRTFPAGVR